MLYFSCRLNVARLPFFAIFFAGLGWHLNAAEPPPRLANFNRDVRAILAKNCFACHGFDEAAREADLRLDTRDGALDSGTVIVPGKPDESELIERIVSEDADLVMPPKKSGKELSANEKETLRLWIEQGAPYETHWAFELPKRKEPPHSADSVDPNNAAVISGDHPIDRFVRARLATEDLTASPTASATTLIRRLSLDLVGLPPTSEEVDSFLDATREDPNAAYDALVQRLLDSPHYGERWGRWWLDQARYADSNGYSIDAPRQIWKFRDWVVEALNADMPFDVFTIEQLAGDLLPNATENQKIATGFHRNTQINQEGGIDVEQFRIDSVFDRVATTGTVWLGLTVGCAQCHDHKFDPIAQTDYYRMFAFFNNQDEPTLKVFEEDVDADQLSRDRQTIEQQMAEILKDRADGLKQWEMQLSDEAKKNLPPNVRKAFEVDAKKRKIEQKRILLAASGEAGAEFTKLNVQLASLEEKLEQAATTLVLSERKEPRKSTVLIKGDFTRPADEVTPGTLSILHPLEKSADYADRFDLAKWLVSPNNPLTSRVIVNRVWQVYFGRGLVETENDFGLQGSPPSHPELLDWLALEFIERGWSLKELHRFIVTSNTYRQSSSDRPELVEKDPENILLGRQRRLRLEAEIVRDVALVASGLFSPKVGGPPVYPPIPDGVMGQGQVQRSWKASEGEDRYRRGLYTFVYRATPPPSLNVFDAPDGFSSCTRRIRSNTPLQALTLLNDPAYQEFARALEEIVKRDGVEVAFRRCTSRQPTPDELSILSRLNTLNAARVLLNLDETVTRE